jgi:hypothetical protein
VGRYGDNHVVPSPLFDQADPAAQPPRDAVDVQFRLPSSLNAMLDGMARAERKDLLDGWRSVFAEIADDTVMFLQRGGYAVDPERSGLAPARLAITAVMHAAIPGFEVARWHLHLYVGSTATSLLDDRRLAVHWDSIDLAMRGPTQARHINQVWARTAALWGVRWDRPLPGAEQEIVEPPWHEHIDSLDRGVCPGTTSWGPHKVMVADEHIVQMALRDQEVLARVGPGWTRAKLLFEDDEDDALSGPASG